MGYSGSNSRIAPTTPQNITIHIKSIYSSKELLEEATCKDYLQVRFEGSRQVERQLKHYNLEMILSIGYRLDTSRGIEFRQWATTKLKEYLVKGFVMNDERLKNPGGDDYFDELLKRIREIRVSEKLFYQKVNDLYTQSVDYNPKSEDAILFFKTVQNKMLFAITGMTAAELVFNRSNASLPHFGATNWQGAMSGKPISRWDHHHAKRVD